MGKLKNPIYRENEIARRSGQVIHCKFRCTLCNREIKEGNRYYNKRAYEAHVRCVKKQDKIENKHE